MKAKSPYQTLQVIFHFLASAYRYTTYKPKAGAILSTITAGEAYNNYWGQGAVIAKASDVTAPSMTFMAVEDTDWRGFNDGSFVVNWQLNGASPGSFTWEDPLAMYHNNVNIWMFVDGHVEPHKWTDKTAIAEGLQAAKGVPSAGYSAATTGNDYNYIRNRFRFPGWH